MDRWAERFLHTDNNSLLQSDNNNFSRSWKPSVTSDIAAGTEQQVWYKQFTNPLSEPQLEALLRALVDFGVIDDVNTPQAPNTYQLISNKEGKIWQLRIPEESYPKLTLAREAYGALRAQGWEEQKYIHPTSMVTLLAYSKSFNSPLVDANQQATEAGKAIETALQRFGLTRGKHYDWNDENAGRLKMPEASYQRFMAAAFPKQPESPAR